MESRDFIDPNQLASNKPKSTPNEKTEFKLDGQNFEIDIEEILSILNNTVQKYFDSVDYSLLTSPKSLLNHFYFNEKECISKIKNNPNYSYSKKKFYKNLIYDSIEEIFHQAPEKLTKDVFEGIAKIRDTLYKKEKKKEEVTLGYFYKLEEEILGTKDVPKFLVGKDIKYIKFRENYDKKEKKRPELEEIINYYLKIQNGQLKPFDYIHNKSQLFDIFVLSNSDDIEKNDMVREIFIENYKEILSWFNLNIDTRDFEFVNMNFIEIKSVEKKDLLENLFIPINYEINFSNNKEEDIFLILISSLFFCILNKMKEPQKGNYINDGKIKDIRNNINNSRIIKFFSNTVNNIVTYIDNCKYDIKNLINSLFIFVMNENNISDKEKNSSISLISIINSQKENIEYDFKMIEEMIMNSDDNNLKERFNSLKKGLIIEPFNLPQSLIGTFFKRVIGVFTTNSYYYANYIRLSPFQKFISSNIVSIFISGFGSENDAHSIEWRKYLENAPDNTNYYFYHWPADSFTKIVIKSLPISLSGIGIDSDLPKVFLDSKKKAATCGKILALIIKSNLFFEKRQINLVAFSLGNHVVKSCLRELRTYDDNKCIINDVTFIAGATTFKNKINWYNRFKRVVGGRIINCYSDKDYILKLLYKNCTGNAPIGNHAININNGFKDGKNIIENYDFSDLKLGHLDYRKNFNKIIKRIMK